MVEVTLEDVVKMGKGEISPLKFQDRIKESHNYKLFKKLLGYLKEQGLPPTRAADIISVIKLEVFSENEGEEVDIALKAVAFSLAQGWYVYEPLIGHKNFVEMIKRSTNQVKF